MSMGPILSKDWMVLIILFSMIGMVLFSGCFGDGGEDFEFLLLEDITHTYSKLVSGNYTGGEECFDFPTYNIDKENHVLEDWGNEKKSGFSLAYASGIYSSEVETGGGATGVRYFNAFPITLECKAIIGGTEPVNVSTVIITLYITEDLKVLINNTDELLPGESLEFRYEYEKVVHNPDDTNCTIKYWGVTRITNYGTWEYSDIKW